MKQFLLSLIITFSFATLSVDSYALSDDQLAEITTSLENLSTNELIERRELLLAQLDELADGDEVASDDVDTEEEIEEEVNNINSILAEISVIEALLAVFGIVFADDILSDDDKDTEAPVISILGDNPATVELGSTYTDEGATATDNSGSAVVTSSGTVDTNTVGSYTITYTATDASGNSSSATRTVNVVDTTAPVITVTGDNPAIVELGTAYTDAGATATDASGTVSVTSSGTVDTNTLGSYTITYSSTDASGNTGTATRTVNVVDTTPPVITILGDNPATLELGDTYVDGNATATDLSGAIEVSASDDIDPDAVGTYTVTYTATDSSGNTAVATRTVNVVDTTAPVFTSVGTYSVDENTLTIGIASATDLGGVTITAADGGSRFTFAESENSSSSPATLLIRQDAANQGYNDFETYQSWGCPTGYEANGYRIRATDPSGNSTDQNICIQINNINDVETVVT